MRPVERESSASESVESRRAGAAIDCDAAWAGPGNRRMTSCCICMNRPAEQACCLCFTRHTRIRQTSHAAGVVAAFSTGARRVSHPIIAGMTRMRSCAAAASIPVALISRSDRPEVTRPRRWPQGSPGPRRIQASAFTRGWLAGSAHDLPTALAAMEGTPASKRRPGGGRPTLHPPSSFTAIATRRCIRATAPARSLHGRGTQVDRGKANEPPCYRTATPIPAQSTAMPRVGAPPEHRPVHGGGHTWFGGEEDSRLHERGRMPAPRCLVFLHTALTMVSAPKCELTEMQVPVPHRRCLFVFYSSSRPRALTRTVGPHGVNCSAEECGIAMYHFQELAESPSSSCNTCSGVPSCTCQLAQVRC